MNASNFFSNYLSSEFTVPREHAGKRLDVFLALKAGFLSRSRIKQKINDGDALVGGRRKSPAFRLKEGLKISVTWRKIDDRPRPDPPDIIYEDEYIIAVNKPPSIAVHPSGSKQSRTVIQSVVEHYKDEIQVSLEQGREGFYPRLVNRLDYFTSGIVLISKVKEAALKMQKIVEERKIKKRYQAIVEGTIEPAEGVIDAPIGKDRESTIMVKQAVASDGCDSVTEYKVIEHLKGHTLLYAYPLTGRQHQIRVHLAHIGHPVWGDLLYKDENRFLQYYESGCSTENLPERHALHADSVVFEHPFTGETIRIEALLPKDMREIIEQLRSEK